MESLILGFLTGGSLILAIGPQNLFVIEQGLKKNFVFIVTSICSAIEINGSCFDPIKFIINHFFFKKILENICSDL